MKSTNRNIRKSGRTYTSRELKDIRLRVESGEHLKAIAKDYGVNYNAIRQLLIRNGVKYLSTRGRLLRRIDEIKDMIDAGFTVQQMAERLCTTERGVKAFMSRHGLSNRNGLKEKRKAWRRIYDWYAKDINRTYVDVSERFNIRLSTIKGAFRRHDFPMKRKRT